MIKLSHSIHKFVDASQFFALTKTEISTGNSLVGGVKSGKTFASLKFSSKIHIAKKFAN